MAAQQSTIDKDEMIAALKAELAAKTSQLQKNADKDMVAAKKSLVLNRIMEKYNFFRSSVPNVTFTLPEGTKIAFVPRSRVTAKDPSTGAVSQSETWGEFFTKSREVTHLLDEACHENQMLRRMTGEELHQVRERIALD